MNIPAAALEAGVKAFAEAEANDYTTRDEDLAAAFLAMIEAWEGMRISWLALNDGAIVLPLFTEASDGR
jgi:hypothetical protein